MINFSNLPQTITAAFGAVVLSTMFLGAAIGPAHGVSTQTAQVSAQVHA